MRMFHAIKHLQQKSRTFFSSCLRPSRLRHAFVLCILSITSKIEVMFECLHKNVPDNYLHLVFL